MRSVPPTFESDTGLCYISNQRKEIVHPTTAHGGSGHDELDELVSKAGGD